MVEIQTVIQDVLGVAGWALAAYQFWRNEFTKRPLVILTILGTTRDGLLQAKMTVRNRSPFDIFVHRAVLVRPADGGFRYAVGPPFNIRDIKYDFSRDLTLNWQLRAYAGGDFPSESCSFSIGAKDVQTGWLEIACVISRSRDMTASKRRIVRQRITTEKR